MCTAIRLAAGITDHGQLAAGWCVHRQVPPFRSTLGFGRSSLGGFFLALFTLGFFLGLNRILWLLCSTAFFFGSVILLCCVTLLCIVLFLVFLCRVWLLLWLFLLRLLLFVLLGSVLFGFGFAFFLPKSSIDLSQSMS